MRGSTLAAPPCPRLLPVIPPTACGPHPRLRVVGGVVDMPNACADEHMDKEQSSRSFSLSPTQYINQPCPFWEHCVPVSLTAATRRTPFFEAPRLRYLLALVLVLVP